jgi:hypothetical protein
VLNGELVEDLERMNVEHPGDLYVTPVAYDGVFALSAFTDRQAMLAEARTMTDSVTFGWLAEERGIGCLPEGAPAPTELVCFDLLNLGGDQRLRTGADKNRKDLSLVPRRGFLNWDNCIRSVDVCAYSYSAFSEKNFRGVESFINFRCGFNPTAWGLNTSSIINWGTGGPYTERHGM